jgi:tRNA-2-methylthio-N6-dimethylallyladenosine synthase
LERARHEGRSISLARDDDPILFPADTAARAAGPRAFVTVMEGCDKSCAYCIVPHTRGREAYRPAGAVLAEVSGLAQRGYCEIELLGQNVNAYHHQGDDLASLLRRIDAIPGVRRTRFTTSHPGHLKKSIMDAMGDIPSVCNHLHLPAQSGSDRILRRMKRGYSRTRYLEKIAYLSSRVPRITFSTDIIVGFPGETEMDFQETMELLEEVGFQQVYAFTYSLRPGTAAAALDETVFPDVKSERLQRLLALQESIQRRLNAAVVGRTFEVLVDGPSRLDESVAKGRTTCNRIVHVPGELVPQSSFLDVLITQAHVHSLSGVPVGDGNSA